MSEKEDLIELLDIILYSLKSKQKDSINVKIEEGDPYDEVSTVFNIVDNNITERYKINIQRYNKKRFKYSYIISLYAANETIDIETYKYNNKIRVKVKNIYNYLCDIRENDFCNKIKYFSINMSKTIDKSVIRNDKINKLLNNK